MTAATTGDARVADRSDAGVPPVHGRAEVGVLGGDGLVGEVLAGAEALPLPGEDDDPDLGVEVAQLPP